MANPVVASSYFHPDGGDVYKELRQKVVMQATAMGYDVPTLTEHGVDWADDQDPFGHVGGATYSRLIYSCNFRLFESFARTLKDKYEELYRARGVGVLTKSYSMDLRRQVTYPDSVSTFSIHFTKILEGFIRHSLLTDCWQLMTAARITEVKPDRYFCFTSIWSYQQQAIVAESSGYVVFFDYRKGKIANLIEYGGVYADLHADLTDRSQKANDMNAKWVKENPKKSKGPKL